MHKTAPGRKGEGQEAPNEAVSYAKSD